MAITIPLEKIRHLSNFIPEHWTTYSPIAELGHANEFFHAPPELREAVGSFQRSLRASRTMGGVFLATAVSGSMALASGVACGAGPAFLGVPLAVAAYAPLYLRADYWHHFRRPLGKIAIPAAMVGAISSAAGFGVVAGGQSIIGGGVAAAVIAFLASHRLFRPPPEPTLFCFPDTGPEREVLRGPVIHKSVNEIQKITHAAIVNMVEGVTYREEGGYSVVLKPYDVIGHLPIARHSASNSHTVFVGMSGSGKTVSLRTMMATLLPLPGDVKSLPERNPIREAQRREIHQAIMYDAKTENIPVLCGHGFVPRRDLFILNPFDRRAVAWDMARDIKTPSQAKLLAKTFLKSNDATEQGHQHHEYFRTNAARQITAVIQTLIHCGGDNPQWTLRDIINACSSPAVLRHVLSHHPEGSAIIDSTMNIARDTADGIFSSTTTYLDEFRILASLWHRIAQEETVAGEITSISLTDWVREGRRSVLLLPNTRENEAIIKPLNQLVFQRLADLLLNSTYNKHVETGADNVKRRRVVLLDECPTLGRLQGLGELLAEGREFGVQLVLGVQAYSQMVTAYGEQEAKTILGQCGFKAFLKCDGNTAEWASKEIGQQLERYKQMSYTVGRSGSTTVTRSASGGSSSETSGWNNSQTTAHIERMQDAVLASELRSLPDPTSYHGVAGYYMTPHLPVWTLGTMFSDLPQLQYSSTKVSKREDADTSHEWLPPWDESDYAMLGLKPYEKKTKQAGSPPPPPPPKGTPPGGDPQDLF